MASKSAGGRKERDFPQKEVQMSLFLVLIVPLVLFVLFCLVVVLLPPLRYSAAIHTVEAACGLGAGVVGCLWLASALFGPVYRFLSCSGSGTDASTMSSCQSGTATMFQVGISPSAFLALGILLLGPIW